MVSAVVGATADLGCAVGTYSLFCFVFAKANLATSSVARVFSGAPFALSLHLIFAGTASLLLPTALTTTWPIRSSLPTPPLIRRFGRPPSLLLTGLAPSRYFKAVNSPTTTTTSSSRLTETLLLLFTGIWCTLCGRSIVS